MQNCAFFWGKINIVRGYTGGGDLAIAPGGWNSLLTSYPPSGIELCEPEEAEGDGRPVGRRWMKGIAA